MRKKKKKIAKLKPKPAIEIVESDSDEDDQPGETTESWCDRTMMCCCIWPLLWRGKYAEGCLGTSASCSCRVIRLFLCMFLGVLVMALAGGIATLVNKADPTAKSFPDIWRETVARKMAGLPQSEL